MRCHSCNSDEHLVADCPQRQGSFGGFVESAGPLAEYTADSVTVFMHYNSDSPDRSAPNPAQQPLGEPYPSYAQQPPTMPQVVPASDGQDPFLRNDPWMTGLTATQRQGAYFTPQAPASSVPEATPFVANSGGPDWSQQVITQLTAQVQQLQTVVTLQQQHLQSMAQSSSSSATPSDRELPTWARNLTRHRIDLEVPQSGVPQPQPFRSLWHGAATTGTELQVTQNPATERSLEAIQRHHQSQPPDPALTPHIVSTLTDASSQLYIDQLLNVHNYMSNTTTFAGPKGKGRGKTGERIRIVHDVDGATTFDGNDTFCSLCQEAFQEGEQLVRIICRHIFHLECWHEWIFRSELLNPECPNCRGSGRVIARFPYVEDHSDSYTSAVDSSDTAHHVLPWWPFDQEQPRPFYHAATQLPDGRLSIIVDVGAWTNLVGKETARKIAASAKQAGLYSSQKKLPKPLTVQGVGEGSQACGWLATLPIAVSTVASDNPGDPDSESVQRHDYEAPVLEGEHGQHCPGLLGLRSLQAKGAVLQLDVGKKLLTFPGPSGYKIEWGPGATHIKMESAPSGHYVIPVDSYGKLPAKSPGLAPKSCVLTVSQPPCTGSSDTLHDATAQSSHE